MIWHYTALRLRILVHPVSFFFCSGRTWFAGSRVHVNGDSKICRFGRYQSEFFQRTYDFDRRVRRARCDRWGFGGRVRERETCDRCFGRWFLMKTTKKSVFLGFCMVSEKDLSLHYINPEWFVWSWHKRSVYSGIDFSCHRTRCVNWPVIVVV